MLVSYRCVSHSKDERHLLRTEPTCTLYVLVMLEQ